MFQKNSVIQRIYCNVYVSIYVYNNVNKTPVCLNFILHELRVGQSITKNYIKMLKRKSDELEILEKLVKKKQISLDLISIALPLFNKAKNDSKSKKTTSSPAPRLVKYNTVDENCIEKSLAPFKVRNWL